MEFSHKEEMSPFLFIQLFMHICAYIFVYIWTHGCSVYSTGYLALSSLYCCKDYPRIGNRSTIKVIPYSFHMFSFFFKLWWKTQHKSYHLNHFKTYSGANYMCIIVQDLANFFILQNWITIPIEQLLANTILLSVSQDLITLDNSSKWNYVVLPFCDWLYLT